MQIPIELIEQVANGNCVLFAGAGISVGTHGQRGLPSGSDLAQALATRCGYTGSDLSLPRVAQYYELENGRQALVEFITNEIADPQIAPLFIHQLTTWLPFRVVITTNWDRLLERACERASKPYRLVVRNEEISYLAPDKFTLIKIHGSVEQPDTLVITEDDYLDFFSELPTVATVLKAEFATKPLLFLGYSLEDINFKRLYAEVTRELDRHKRLAYAVQRAPSGFAVKWWRQSKEVEIIDADATEFLQALATEVEQFTARSRAIAIPLKREPIHLIPKRPYKALNYFEPEDEDMFFGRREEVQRLLSLITSYRLVVLYGESGAGKTSLINAGVIPNLTRAGYLVISVRALEDPAAAIQREVNRHLSEPIKSTSSLWDFLKQATDVLKTLGKDPASPMQGLVVILDQFEEFFIRLSPEFRTTFIEELGEVYDGKDLPVKFVFSLREDYFARLSELEWRIPEVFRNKSWLRRLTRHQAAEAITEPVRPLGINYDPALLERLLDDLFKEGVYPPHLQIVCNQLYDTLDGSEKQITLAHYEKLGRTEHILATYTTDVLAEFPGHLATIARVTLIELVTSLNTKAVLEEPTLVARVGGHPEDQAAVWDKLVNTRLIRRYEREGNVYYELAHEYLVGEITPWIDEKERELKKARELLAQELDNWHRYRMLVPQERLVILSTYRERLELDADAQELLLRSSFAADVEPVAWLQRVTRPEIKERVLLEAVHNSEPAIRMLAVSELVNVLGDLAYEPLLGAALEDSETAIRWTAAEELLRIAPAVTAERLVQEAKNGNYARALQALVVLWEGGTPIHTTSYLDLVGLLFTALAMNFAGRRGPLRQFGVFGLVGGLLGGIIGGMILSVTGGYFVQQSLATWSAFLKIMDQMQQVVPLLPGWSVQISGLAMRLIPTDPAVRLWLLLALILYTILWVLLRWLQRSHLVIRALLLLWQLPMVIIAGIIRWLRNVSLALLPFLFLLAGYAVFLVALLYGALTIRYTLLGGGVALFVGIGAGIVEMWSLGTPKRRKYVAGPALGYLALAAIWVVFSVGIAVIQLLRQPSVYPSVVDLIHRPVAELIGAAMYGSAIGFGTQLALSSNRWLISTGWAWRIICWIVRCPDLSYYAPNVSLVGLSVALAGSVACSLLLRQSAGDLFVYGLINVMVTLTLAMAHAVPIAIRQEIVKLGWLQKEPVSMP
jgi:hypothetical protein